MVKATIWSKDRCAFCERAKDLLAREGIEFEERNVSSGTWTREQLMKAVPTARTVPQIFLDGVHVGGFNELRQRLIHEKR